MLCKLFWVFCEECGMHLYLHAVVWYTAGCGQQVYSQAHMFWVSTMTLGTMANSELQWFSDIPSRVLFSEGFTQLANDLLDPHAVSLALFPDHTTGEGVTRTSIQYSLLVVLWRAQDHSELTHHTNDITLQHYNGFGYVQSTAPKFMMWLLGKPYKLLRWPCMQMGMVQAIHWSPVCSTTSQPQ